MNPRLRMYLLSQGMYCEPAGDGTDGGGGGGSGDGDAAAQAAADAAAAASALADAAAAKGDGEKKIDAETAILLKDVMKWKDKARTTETEKAEIADKLKQINAVLGEEYKLEDIKALIDAKKTADTAELERKGQYDRILESMKTENQKAIDALTSKDGEKDQTILTLKQQVEELTVGRAFSDSVYIRENSLLPPAIARKEFGAHFDTVDGALVAFDKPRGAKERTPLVDAQGNNKSFEAAIADLYAKHSNSGDILKSKRKPGAGSKTEETSKGAQASPKTGAEKIAAGLAKLASK